MIKHSIQMNSKAYAEKGVELIQDLVKQGYSVECTSRSAVYTIKAEKKEQELPREEIVRALTEQCLKDMEAEGLIPPKRPQATKKDWGRADLPIMKEKILGNGIFQKIVSLEELPDDYELPPNAVELGDNIWLVPDPVSTSGDNGEESLDSGTSTRAHAHVRERDHACARQWALSWIDLKDWHCDDQVDSSFKCIVVDIPFKPEVYSKVPKSTLMQIGDALKLMESKGVINRITKRVKFEETNKVVVVADGILQFDGDFDEIVHMPGLRHFYVAEYVFNGDLDQNLYIFSSSRADETQADINVIAETLDIPLAPDESLRIHGPIKVVELD